MVVWWCGGWARANMLQLIPASTSDPTADLAPDLVNSPSGEQTTSKDPSTNGIVLPAKDSMDGEESGGSAGAAIVLSDIPMTLQTSSHQWSNPTGHGENNYPGLSSLRMESQWFTTS